MVMLVSAHGQKTVSTAKPSDSKPQINRGTRPAKLPVSKPTILSKTKETGGKVDSVVGDEPLGDSISRSSASLPGGVIASTSTIKPLVVAHQSDGPLTNTAQEATAAEGLPDEVGGRPEKPGPKRDGPSIGVS